VTARTYIEWIDPPLPEYVWGVILGDLHLGGILKNFRIKGLLEILDSPEFRTLRFLGLQGDTFERNGVKTLPEYQRELLRRIRDMEECGVEICFCRGNHDNKLAKPLKKHYFTKRDKEIGREPKVLHEYTVNVFGKNILVMHGHQFDPIISRIPVTGGLGSLIHNLVGRLEGEKHTIAEYLKKQTKLVLRIAKIVEYQAMEYALLKGVDVIVCGHTHIIDHIRMMRDGISEVEYFNVGSFTEKVCGLLTIDWEGNLQVHKIRVHKKPI
jgi:UDP-2,3-diacylglucosamine pyrophosphatase LpxH